MVTTTIPKRKPAKPKNKIKATPQSSPNTNGNTNGTNRQNAGNWPQDIGEAYSRYPGPYTIHNAITLIEEEPLELYNGWLVWQDMTDPPERRVAGNIQEILSLAGRACDFGQGYPDQFECLMSNGDTFKPDVCLVSKHRFDTLVTPISPESEHFILNGGPELVVEIRSPSNRRTKERIKRQTYFENGTLVIWDVDPDKKKIWVYQVENQKKAQEYDENAIMTCERILPGWQHHVADFFTEELLSVEQIVGQVAVEWRAESEAKGRAEGEAKGRAEGEAKGREEGELAGVRKTLLRQANRRFGPEKLPPDFEASLERYNLEQLEQLTDNLTTSTTPEDWLNSITLN